MNIVCFDVGGTFIKYSVINEKGEMLFKDKLPTPREKCKSEIPKLMVEKINDVSKYFKIDAAGVSTAGQVDSENGEIIFASENLPGYTGAKISQYLREELNLHCFVENDVNAAALGEMWRGAARGKDSFVCLTLGTGVGGAIVINGELYKGIKGGAGELGHMIINEEGEDCGCGAKGCLERYSSTSALIRNYNRALMNDGINTKGDISGEKLMDLVKAGDSVASKVYKDFLNHLAVGITNIVHILDPGYVVIGGGISAQGESFVRDLERAFRNKAMKSYSEHTEILLAELSNEAGVYGAAYIALKALKEIE